MFLRSTYASIAVLSASSLFITLAEGRPPLLLVFLLFAAGVALLVQLLRAAPPRKPFPVDIWALHSKLMRASRQSMPSQPQVNRTSILYVALTLEEISEVLEAMAEAFTLSMRENTPSATVAPTLHGMYGRKLKALALSLRFDSVALRRLITSNDCPEVNLKDAAAVELLDGIVDVTVTVAGLALSTGLPAREGYREVGESNISKANPETGVIDVDASGKWIKGSAYFPPNLAAVLEREVTTWEK